MPAFPGQIVLPRKPLAKSHCTARRVFPKQSATVLQVVTITQSQLRNNLSYVLRTVQESQAMTVTRNGTPVAELRPVAARRFVTRTVLEESARNAPRIDARRFQADIDSAVPSS